MSIPIVLCKYIFQDQKAGFEYLSYWLDKAVCGQKGFPIIPGLKNNMEYISISKAKERGGEEIPTSLA